MSSSLDRYVGFNPPFLGGQQNVLSQQSGGRLIKNDIKLLLLTVPGERPMRMDFGTDLRRLPFEQFDDVVVVESLRDQIARQIQQYEPRVRVNSIDVFGDQPTHTLRVVVNVSPIDDPATNLIIETSVSDRGVR